MNFLYFSIESFKIFIFFVIRRVFHLIKFYIVTKYKMLASMFHEIIVLEIINPKIYIISIFYIKF